MIGGCAAEKSFSIRGRLLLAFRRLPFVPSRVCPELLCRTDSGLSFFNATRSGLNR
jgi:hypothetical protein